MHSLCTSPRLHSWLLLRIIGSWYWRGTTPSVCYRDLLIFRVMQGSCFGWVSLKDGYRRVPKLRDSTTLLFFEDGGGSVVRGRFRSWGWVIVHVWGYLWSWSLFTASAAISASIHCSPSSVLLLSSLSTARTCRCSSPWCRSHIVSNKTRNILTYWRVKTSQSINSDKYCYS